jgi:hypothetical protein
MMKTQLMGPAEFGVANKDHMIGNTYGKKGDAKKYGHWKKKVPDDIVIDGVDLTEPCIELLAAKQDERWRKSESSKSSTSQSAGSTSVVLNAPNYGTKLGMYGPQCSRVSALTRSDDYDSAKSDKSVFSKFGRGTAKLLKSISKKERTDVGMAYDPPVYSSQVEYSHITGESTVNISLDGLLITEIILYTGKVIRKRPSAQR